MAQDVMTKKPVLLEITHRLRERLPEATAIIFFGSQATGLADRFSDYDVMVLLPNGLERERRRAVEKKMRKEFPSLKLDLVFGSERSLLHSLSYEPYHRFWLESGIVTWGKKPAVREYPPLAKGAMDSRMNVIKSQIELAKVLDDRRQIAQSYLSVLKMLLLIEKALRNEYNSRVVRDELEDLVGKKLIEGIRDPHSQLEQRDIRKLFEMALTRYHLVKGLVDGMRENESDRKWREQWQKRPVANEGSRR